MNDLVRKVVLNTAATALCFGVASLSAKPAMQYFNDNMVLQRNMAVPVFGKAAPGEDVTVSFNGQSKTGKAAADSSWMVKLDAMIAAGPLQMTVRGKTDSVVIANVMVGEVWLCSGQSNMDFSMTEIGGANIDTAKVANIPNLRFMNMRNGLNNGDWHDNTPGGKWSVCNPATTALFSATGFYFGRDVQRALGNVAVGVIESAVGATQISRWMDPVSIKQDPKYSLNASAHGDLYNKFILPLQPYAIRGTVWYQGESDANDSIVDFYHARLAGMIAGWRKAWGQGDFPFFVVQLANYLAVSTVPVDTGAIPFLREQQALTMSVPGTAMAVPIDLGDVNVHGHDKWDLGYRLSLPARALVYGEKNLVYSSPVYESMKIDGKTIRIHFASIGKGLEGKDGAAVKGFGIAGADNKWVAADATIKGDTVIVSAASVAAPTNVRYAWASNPVCNLYSAEGLPAAPFRTDGPKLPLPVTVMSPYRAPFAKAQMIREPATLGFGSRYDGLGRSMDVTGDHGKSAPRAARKIFLKPGLLKAESADR